MRILVATDQWFPDLRGGSARVATETAVRLAGRGHAVSVVAPSSNDAPRCEEIGSLTVHRVLPRGPLPMTITDPVATRRFVRALRGGFDVALAHQSTTGTGVLAARLGVPLALVVHASALRELRFDRGEAGMAGKIRRLGLAPLLARLESSASAKAERLLVLSRFTRSLLAEDRPGVLSRVLRVSGGVDTDLFRPAADRDAIRHALEVDEARPLLFTARRLAPRMGLEGLLRAIARLRPRPLLAIAGSGPLAPSLRRLAGELGVLGDVRFLGRVSDLELVDWYGAADLFVLPTVAYEGFGMVTAEALACGTPVVGTPVGATPELLEPLDAGLVSNGTAPDALAQAISENLPRLDDALRVRCRDYAVERLSWDSVMPGWEAAVEEAAGVEPFAEAPAGPEQTAGRGAA